MSITALIATLEERGVDAATILAAVKAVAVDAAPARSSAAERQARYRVRRLPAREWEPLRLKVFARDSFRCTYCGDAEGPFECDHVVPTSRGGCNDETNLTTACKPCNAAKKDRLVEEWLV
jgi:5-methylcytosine-specific restriction endonuclease McrA